MAKEFVKIDGHTIEERETKVVSQKYDYSQLKIRREVIAKELAKIDALIAQANDLGVVDKLLSGVPKKI